MNSENPVYSCLAIVLLTLSCSARAEHVFKCPPEISVSWSIPSPPTGWQVSNIPEDLSAEHYLVSVTFSDGPPEEGAFLRPTVTRDSKVEGGGSVVEIYDFTSRVNSTIWLICRYGNTPAILSKNISSEVESCEVSRPKDLSGQEARCY